MELASPNCMERITSLSGTIITTARTAGKAILRVDYCARIAILPLACMEMEISEEPP